MLFCDLDAFKAVNDRLGHGSGDRLLVEAAGRLRAAMRSMDTVARLGGDEFAVLVEDLPAEEALATAERVLQVLRHPYSLDGQEEQSVGASIGVALWGTGS